MYYNIIHNLLYDFSDNRKSVRQRPTQVSPSMQGRHTALSSIKCRDGPGIN